MKFFTGTNPCLYVECYFHGVVNNQDENNCALRWGYVHSLWFVYVLKCCFKKLRINVVTYDFDEIYLWESVI